MRVELSLQGPVSPLTGMVVNLVEIDQAARRLLADFERTEFTGAEEAFVFLRDRWIQIAERLELRAEAVGLKGRFGEARLFMRDGERRFQWRLGRFAVNPATGLSGRIFVDAESRAEARRALRQLATLPRLDLVFLADVKWPAGVYAVGFRERKSHRELRLELV